MAGQKKKRPSAPGFRGPLCGKIEQGELGTAIGLVFEVATLVGVKLFDDPVPIRTQREHVQDKIALLPQRIRPPEVDDDF